MENEQTKLPSVVLMIDRERRWQMDVTAFERACEGFEQVGLTEYVDDPISSLKEFQADSGGETLRITRRFTKIFRVWVWAGLTGEEETLDLATISKHISIGTLPKLAVQVMPVLMESLLGPPAATVESSPETVATGLSVASASG